MTRKAGEPGTWAFRKKARRSDKPSPLSWSDTPMETLDRQAFHGANQADSAAIGGVLSFPIWGTLDADELATASDTKFTAGG